MFRRFTAMLIAVMTAFLLSVPVYAAKDTAEATAMTLEKTEGTVTVENSKGRKVTVRDGGRLYNGYRVTTKQGYAWIGLDDKKLIKMDWNTEVTVKKSGKRFEIMLESGELFFDVSSPLKKDEELYIRTSTMYTGVRGTSGIVSARKNNLGYGADMSSNFSSLMVLDGRVKVTRSDEKDLSRINTYLVDAGWKNDIALRMSGRENNISSMSIRSILQKNDPEEALRKSPFAAKEIIGNKQLQDRIEESVPGTDLSDVLDNNQNDLRDKQNEDRRDNSRQEDVCEKEEERIKGIVPEEKEEDLPPIFPGQPEPEPPAPVPEYTVTFWYFDENKQQQIFAIETVKANEPVVQPTLLPAMSGKWNNEKGESFNFGSPVTANTDLFWEDAK